MAVEVAYAKDVSGCSTGIGRIPGLILLAVEVSANDMLSRSISRIETSWSDTARLVSDGNVLAVNDWLVRFLPLQDGCCTFSDGRLGRPAGKVTISSGGSGRIRSFGSGS